MTSIDYQRRQAAALGPAMALRNQRQAGGFERLVARPPAGARGRRPEVTCSPCGAENRASARYCSQCGAHLASG